MDRAPNVFGSSWKPKLVDFDHEFSKNDFIKCTILYRLVLSDNSSKSWKVTADKITKSCQFFWLQISKFKSVKY